MAFQAAQGCASATMTYVDTSTGVHIGENVLTFENIDTEDFTNAECQALAEALGGWWATVRKTIVSAAARLEYVHVRGLDSEAAASYSLLAASVGTVPGERMPSNVSLAVQFKTGLTGRSNRGRSYLTGIPFSAVVEDSITSAFGLNVIAAYADLEPELPAGMQHVVLSRYANGLPRLSAVARKVTTYTLADLKLDTRRARII